MTTTMFIALILVASAPPQPSCPQGSVDYQIAAHFAKGGQDLTTPREISFHVYASDLAHLVSIVEVLEELDMGVTIRDQHDHRTLVMGIREMPVDPARLAEIRCHLDESLEPLNGYYEGWGTGFGPGS